MEKVTLNEKEQKRLLVFSEVLAGRMTGQEAADMLGLSLRDTRRLLARYRVDGAAGLMHGNRGRVTRSKSACSAVHTVTCAICLQGLSMFQSG